MLMPGDVLLAKELLQVSKHDIVLVLEVRMLGMGQRADGWQG